MRVVSGGYMLLWSVSVHLSTGIRLLTALEASTILLDQQRDQRLGGSICFHR